LPGRVQQAATQANDVLPRLSSENVQSSIWAKRFSCDCVIYDIKAKVARRFLVLHAHLLHHTPRSNVIRMSKPDNPVEMVGIFIVQP
jgi:hypothetical protein